MKKMIDRREFLKLSSLASISSLGFSYLLGDPGLNKNVDAPNILIILFDTLSAKHINLYGYPRETMPNLAKFAERANVYHNHYSSSSFTSPATASLLTGVYPWTHEVLSLKHRLSTKWINKNIFNLFKESGYHQIAYSHNPFADKLLRVFRNNIQDYYLYDTFFIGGDFFGNIFANDFDDYVDAKIRLLNRSDGLTNSLGLSQIFDLLNVNTKDEKVQAAEKLFPLGIPTINISIPANYLLEEVIDFIISSAENLPRPYLGYFHLLPPHSPYNTRIDFYQHFYQDGFKVSPKPDNLFSRNVTHENQFKSRTRYDEFILYVDAEFGRLIDSLEQQGNLENTWIIFTSDHGEMFERKLYGHQLPPLYQPVIKVPLLISAPGQNERKDFYNNTSSLDVIPTLLKITGQKFPDWLEGEILPPFRDSPPNDNRDIFAVMGQLNPQYRPLTKATLTLFKDNYKLIEYIGYDELYNDPTLFELYDLAADPEELNDLFDPNTSLTKELNNILQAKLDEINRRYEE